jgi:sortase A
LDAVIRFLRRKRWARRSLSGLSIVLVMVAVGLLAYPLYTDFSQGRLQHRLRTQIASPQIKQSYEAHAAKVGDPLTRIRIPKIDLDVVVVEGTTASALKAGAGHYPSTPLPCEDGNVSIAGHRTTYGKPFANIDQLKPGDLITLDTPVGSCTYAVQTAPFVVLPDGKVPGGGTVIDNTPGEKTLTLTSCHPKGEASHRIVVKATIVKGPMAGA